MAKYCKKCWVLNKNPLIPYCSICYFEENVYKKLTKKIKLVSRKKQEKINSWWGEKAMFNSILIENQDEDWNLTCEISWDKFSINDVKVWCFAHILNKNQFAYLRLFKNNICIVKWLKEHWLVDKYVTWNKREIEKRILNWEKINILNYKK